MLSICVAIKNRSRVLIEGRELRLFPNCVASILKSVANIEAELVVADWNSDDWPLTQWIEAAAHPIPVRLVAETGSFSRGRGLNSASRAAKGDVLFFTDADSLVCPKLIDDGMGYISLRKVFFPIVFAF